MKIILLCRAENPNPSWIRIFLPSRIALGKNQNEGLVVEGWGGGGIATLPFMTEVLNTYIYKKNDSQFCLNTPSENYYIIV